jgi:hypothetical protein
MNTNGEHRNLGGPHSFSETGYSPTIRKGEGAETAVWKSDRFVVEA